MSVWVAMPSKRPIEQAEPILRLWRERGYKIALWRDDIWYGDAAYVRTEPNYPGYAVACNSLCQHIISTDQTAEWIVCAGDDVQPDLNVDAQQIDSQCSFHFREHNGTFGVMQPTGDRWGDAQGAYIDRVAGSPWIGREFARRMYGGAGPYWHEYRHQFVDEELQNVAIKLGVFWQRPDLIHFHQHWGRPRGTEKMAPSERMPAFLAEANSAEHWKKYKALFEARKAAGFPGHEPIP